MIQNFHFVGQDDTSPVYETSLAVRQWMELVRGDREPQAPANRFKVIAVMAEKHYCLRCFWVRTFDVIYAETIDDPVVAGIFAVEGHFQIMRCRCCGKESVKCGKL